MGLFRRKVPLHYIPVHRDNITKRDWIILLEAGTIVGPSAEKLRVALATLEKKIVTKYNISFDPNTSSWSKDTTREFMLCITALSFTSMTPKRSWSLWKVKRSESWSQKRSLRKDGSNCGEPSLPQVATAHPSLL